MSLEHCLLKHRDALKNPEKAEIVAAKQEYMSRGMSDHDAAVRAIKDQINNLEGQRADVVTEGVKQWKELDSASFETKGELGVPDIFFKRIKVDFPIMEEDGTITTEQRSARDALASLDKQEEAYRALRECVA